MRHSFLLVMIGGLFFSCKIERQAVLSNKKISGTYRWSLRHGYGRTITLQLDTDGKFRYECREELLELVSSGTWAIANKGLILNSNSIDGYNGYVTAIDSPGLKNTISIFKNPSGRLYTGLSVVANDKTYQNDLAGKIELPFKLNYVYFKFLTDFQFFYRPQSNTANYFEFTLYPQSSSHIFFINERFKFEKNKFIDSKKHELIRIESPLQN